tara:strand:+ start:37 stop:474 length:438 start_codon:yes stop_codon:yes gene_type:complete
MEKGHYGEYTGNARHSRKEEMIHDRELIYDAKSQLHKADQDYKSDGPHQEGTTMSNGPKEWRSNVGEGAYYDGAQQVVGAQMAALNAKQDIVSGIGDKLMELAKPKKKDDDVPEIPTGGEGGDGGEDGGTEVDTDWDGEGEFFTT